MNLSKFFKIVAFIGIAFGFSYGQTISAPSAYSPVAGDTLSDTALFLVQVPPYKNGASIKMRSITTTQLGAALGGGSDSLVLRNQGPGYLVQTSLGARVTDLTCAAGQVAGFAGGGSFTWYGVMAGPSLIAMGGTSGNIQTTVNGSSFLRPSSPTTNLIRGGTYGLSKYIFVGNLNSDSSGGITVSSDGVTWTGVKGNHATTSYNFVGCSPSTCVIVGPSSRVLTTTNLTTFTTQTYGTAGLTLYGVAWGTGPSLFAAVASNGSIQTSPDGVTWTQRRAASGALYAVTWNASQGQFIAVGGSGLIVTSSDGLTWTPQTSGTTRDLLGLFSNGSTVIAGGDSLKILKSTNGTSWTTLTPPIASALDYNGGAFLGSTYLLAGESGRVDTSGNATTFAQAGDVQPACASVATAQSVSDSITAFGRSGTQNSSFNRVTTNRLEADTIRAKTRPANDTGMIIVRDSVNFLQTVRILTGDTVSTEWPLVTQGSIGIHNGSISSYSLASQIPGTGHDLFYQRYRIRTNPDEIFFSSDCVGNLPCLPINIKTGRSSYDAIQIDTLGRDGRLALRKDTTTLGNQFSRRVALIMRTEDNGDSVTFCIAGGGGCGQSRGGRFVLHGNEVPGGIGGITGMIGNVAGAKFAIVGSDTSFVVNYGGGTEVRSVNLVMGTTTGTGGSHLLVLPNNATAPSVLTDRTTIYSADISAGNAALAVWSEAAASAAVATASTNKIPFVYNGTTYYILVTTVP